MTEVAIIKEITAKSLLCGIASEALTIGEAAALIWSMP
jgi:hypothetical protein